MSDAVETETLVAIAMIEVEGTAEVEDVVGEMEDTEKDNPLTTMKIPRYTLPNFQLKCLRRTWKIFLTSLVRSLTFKSRLDTLLL